MSWQKFESSDSISSEYNRGNDCKIFQSSAKLIARYSDYDEAFKSTHQAL